MKKMAALVGALCIACLLLVSCGGQGATGGSQSAEGGNKTGLEPGRYTAKFDTDSSMFGVNEYYEGRGTLEVSEDGATLHVVLRGDGIVKLFVGTAEDAQKGGAVLLEPTEEVVTYADGLSKTCNAFDIPIAKLDEEFDCAILGAKGSWYDHKVVVSDPQLVQLVKE